MVFYVVHSSFIPTPPLALSTELSGIPRKPVDT